MKESTLTEFVRCDLESIGFTTYAEVCNGNKRCDMYAVLQNNDNTKINFIHTIAFEAKLTFNFKVLQQGVYWQNKANEVYLIVPAIFKNLSDRKFARDICKILGIGVMEVNIKTKKYNITVQPKWYPNPKLPTLYEEQKYTIASNSENDYVTPFKITVKNLNEFMLDKERFLMIDLVKNIKHHYKGNISAVRALTHLIREKVIKGFYISKENNKIVLIKDGF